MKTLILCLLVFVYPVSVFADEVRDYILYGIPTKKQINKQNTQPVKTQPVVKPQVQDKSNPTGDPEIGEILNRLNSMRTKKPLTNLPEPIPQKVNP
jgi:hypothetical protein